MRQKLFLAVLLTLSFAFSNRLEAKGSFKKSLKEATKYFEMGDYKNARKLLEDLHKQDSNHVDVAYKLGVCMFELKVDKLEAVPLFELASKNKMNESHYYLGRLYHVQKRFKDAIEEYNTYMSFVGQRDHDDDEVNRLKANVLYAESCMQKEDRSVKITNLGNTINSEYSDYAPLVSSDESILYFTSRREGSTGNLLDPNGEYYEDIYVSYKKNDRWTAPESVSDYINTFTNDATVALSPGGNELYIFRTSEEQVTGDIYVSRLEGRDWTNPEKLSNEINSEDGVEASASITPDGGTMYFSSNREGGYGGKDIYRVIKLPNGKWSKAFNLGPDINTAYDEDFPYIHPDGKTLYFSSNGHTSMGGYDIYITQVSTWGTATKPENLGCPINTVEDDVCFVLAADGKYGYYSSIKPDTKGSTDIYRIKMPQKDAAIPVIRGRVFTGDRYEKPIQANITLIDQETHDVIGDYISNLHNGNFIMVFELEKYYKILVEAPGFYPYSDDFWISELPEEGYVKEIKLVVKDDKK